MDKRLFPASFLLIWLVQIEARCDSEWSTVVLTNSLYNFKTTKCRQSVCVDYKNALQENNNRSSLRYWYEEQNTYPSSTCSLVIRNSTLNIIEEKMFPAAELLQLFLNTTNVKDIRPKAFEEFPSLNELYLQDNRLTTLNEDTFSALTRLEYLFLERNQLHVLKNPFKNTKELILLKLNDNRLESLEQLWFDPIPNLKFLDISNNPFKKIDHVQLYLFQFSARSLGLNAIEFDKSHRLSSGKDIVINVNATNLLTLDASGNQISELNKSVFRDAQAIFYLNLSGNAIDVVDEDAFSHLHRLKTLDLSHNNLKELAHGLFQNLSNLQTLDLSGNQLRTIQYGLFDSLNQLSSLNLSSNEIEEVNLVSHRSPTYMDLYLDNNDLKELALNNLEGIRKIALDNNMWHCKILASIISYLEQHEVEIVYGTSPKTENIRKIACDNSKFVLINHTHTTQDDQKVRGSLITDFERSKMNSFLNEGFKRSAFYNYFSSFSSAATNLDQHYKEAIESLKNISNHFVALSKTTQDYGGKKNIAADNLDSLRIVLFLIAIALYGLLCMLIVLLYLRYKKRDYSTVGLSHRNLNLEMI